jgi:TDG/mug DNA glycosylase family protein
MESVVGIPANLPYSERVERLTKSGIAIWDVLSHAHRVGALDVNITREVTNDFHSFFGIHRAIELVCFNGATAEKLYSRLVRPTPPAGWDAGLKYEVLPSTSPMHTVGIKDKVSRWSTIRQSLDFPF